MDTPWLIRLFGIKSRRIRDNFSQNRGSLPKGQSLRKWSLIGGVCGLVLAFRSQTWYEWPSYLLWGVAIGAVLCTTLSFFKARRAALLHGAIVLVLLLSAFVLTLIVNPRFSLLRASSSPFEVFQSKPWASRTQTLAQSQVLSFDGRNVSFVVDDAAQVSKHRELIYSVPILIRNGDVHDIELDSKFPIYVQGNLRNAKINAGDGGVIVSGSATDSSIVSRMIQINGPIARSNLLGHVILLGGSADSTSKIARVPTTKRLPLPRDY